MKIVYKIVRVVGVIFIFVQLTAGIRWSKTNQKKWIWSDMNVLLLKIATKTTHSHSHLRQHQRQKKSTVEATWYDSLDNHYYCPFVWRDRLEKSIIWMMKKRVHKYLIVDNNTSMSIALVWLCFVKNICYWTYVRTSGSSLVVVKKFIPRNLFLKFEFWFYVLCYISTVLS